MSTLPAYLRQKREALDRLRRHAIAGLGGPQTLTAQVTAQGLGGVRRVRIREFQFLSDDAVSLAGQDLGPSAPELQVGVIGSCMTHVLLIKAAERGIALHALQVAVSGALTPAELQELRYHVTLACDAPAAEIAALQAEVERVCPILNLVTRAHALQGTLQHTPSGEPTDLRDHLSRRRAAAARTPQQLQATITAEGRSGVRRIRLRDAQLISDSPPEFAGYSLGPSSPEIQLAALGSCLTHTFLAQAATQGVPLDALQVTVSGEQDERGVHPEFAHLPWYPQNLRYTLSVRSPADARTLHALLDQTEAASPLVNLLRRPQTVHGELTQHSAAEAHTGRFNAIP